MKRLVLFFFIIHCSIIGKSQNEHLSSQSGESSIGLGLGLSYGGIGLRLGTNIAKGLSLFGGVGYQLVGVGYNLGLTKDFPSSSMAQFYLTGMYGINAAIAVEGAPEFDNLYTGPTFGIGAKVNSRKTEGNYWDVGILTPIRSSQYKDDEEALRRNPFITEFSSPWPVLIVLGYNFHL